MSNTTKPRKNSAEWKTAMTAAKNDPAILNLIQGMAGLATLQVTATPAIERLLELAPRAAFVYSGEKVVFVKVKGSEPTVYEVRPFEDKAAIE